jgi:hypothetical protein
MRLATEAALPQMLAMSPTASLKLTFEPLPLAVALQHGSPLSPAAESRRKQREEASRRYMQQRDATLSSLRSLQACRSPITEPPSPSSPSLFLPSPSPSSSPFPLAARDALEADLMRLRQKREVRAEEKKDAHQQDDHPAETEQEQQEAENGTADHGNRTSPPASVFMSTVWVRTQTPWPESTRRVHHSCSCVHPVMCVQTGTHSRATATAVVSTLGARSRRTVPAARTAKSLGPVKTGMRVQCNLRQSDAGSQCAFACRCHVEGAVLC